MTLNGSIPSDVTEALRTIAQSLENGLPHIGIEDIVEAIDNVADAINNVAESIDALANSL